MTVDSDDEFGYSSGDNAELLSLSEQVVQPLANAKKRNSDHVDGSQTKRQRVERTASPTEVDENDEFGLNSGNDEELIALSQRTITDPEMPGRMANGSPSGVAASLASSVALTTLQERFGLQTFRLKQAAAITRLLEGGSCTVVFPTGTYQISFSFMSRRLTSSQVVANRSATRSRP